MNNDTYYPDLSRGEFDQRVRELHREGIDVVYLDEEEFTALKRKMEKDWRVLWMGVSEKDFEQAEFMIYKGMKFDIVESLATYSQLEWLRAQAYNKWSRKDTY